MPCVIAIQRMPISTHAHPHSLLFRFVLAVRRCATVTTCITPNTSTFHIWITNRAIHKLLWLMCMKLSTAWLLFICCACNSPFTSYLGQYNTMSCRSFPQVWWRWVNFWFYRVGCDEIVYAPLFTPKICYATLYVEQTHFLRLNEFDIRCDVCMRPILRWHTIQITTATKLYSTLKTLISWRARWKHALNEKPNKNTNKNTQLRKLIYAKTSFYDNGIRFGVGVCVCVCFFGCKMILVMIKCSLVILIASHRNSTTATISYLIKYILLWRSAFVL